MPLLTLIIILAVIGLIVWLVTTYIPMSPAFRRIIIVVAIIVVVVFLLQVFGFLDTINTVRIGR